MAGCCVTLSGMPKDCGNSIGGIRRAWGACSDDVSRPVLDSQSGMITSIPETEPWHLYEFRKQTGSVTSTYNNDDAGGAKFWESDIVFQFLKQETSKRIEINALAASDTDWIIEDNNGKYWYFGFFQSVTLGEGTAETGTAFTDFNGYNITLNEVSQELPFEITADAMAGILGEEEGQ